MDNTFHELDLLEKAGQLVNDESTLEDVLYLDACEGHKESKDVIGSLKDSEYPQIAHHFFQAALPHVAHSTENLDSFIRAEPGRLLPTENTSHQHG